MKTCTLVLSGGFHNVGEKRVRVPADWRTQHDHWTNALSEGQLANVRKWACPSGKECKCGSIDGVSARELA